MNTSGPMAAHCELMPLFAPPAAATSTVSAATFDTFAHCASTSATCADLCCYFVNTRKWKSGHVAPNKKALQLFAV